ncbi:hypothetical protein DFQ26_001234 [Actinomortierella ambigua]|nr:hypothetical protein DFQ26_001234 [Actinomortierella ambigua]
MLGQEQRQGQKHRESSRSSKSSHPLFQDLQKQQQQQKQQKQQQQQQQRPTPLPGNLTQSVDSRIKPRKDIAATSTAGANSGSPLHAKDATKARLRQETFAHQAYTHPSNDPMRSRILAAGGYTTPHDYLSAPPSPPPQEDALEQSSPSPPGFMGLHGSTSSSSFTTCRTPAQLRRAIHHFLASHPQPSSQHLVEMLQTCVLLGQMASSTTDPHRRGAIGGLTRVPESDDTSSSSSNNRSNSNSDGLDLLSNALLDSIYHSLGFSSDEVFELATWIYQRGWEQDRQITPMDKSGTINTATDRHGLTTLAMRPTPSVAVMNCYLRVCSTTHHVDRAIEMFDDRERLLKDVKPDVTSSPSSLSSTPLRMDAKAQEIIRVASKSLAHQARYPYWIKMLLGAMIGGTVGKFTTLGLMALPIHTRGGGGGEVGQKIGVDMAEGGPYGLSTSTAAAEEAMEAASHIGSSLSVDGILHALASPEVATTAGLATFALSFGLFLIRDTTTSAAISPMTMVRTAHHRPPPGSDLHKRSAVAADVDVQDEERERGGGGEGRGEELGTTTLGDRGEDDDDDEDGPEQILDRLQQVQQLPRAQFAGPYFFQDLVSTDEEALRRYLEEQYQKLKKVLGKEK